MKYLLDTHVWIWRLENNAALSQRVQRDVFGSPPPYGVSLISIWEMANKVRKRQLQLTMPLREWIKRAMACGDFQLMPLDDEVLISANELPGEFHADPADRMIVATARLHRLILATRDERIHRYPCVQSIWT